MIQLFGLSEQMKKRAILVYISTYEKELHPAIFTLKAYALFHSKEDLTIKTRVIKPGRIKMMAGKPYEDISGKQSDLIVDSILKEKPLFVGFSTYVWNIRLTLKIIKLLKKKQPSLPVIVGGAEATYNAKKLINDYIEIDIAALDEGEETFVDLIKYFSHRKNNLGLIKGIVFRENKKIVETEKRQPLDLKRIPSPYLMDLIKINKKQTITMETSRGCPFKCAYCSYNMFSYAHLRFFPLTNVKKEFVYILKRKPKRIYVIDDNFNIYEPRAKKILSTITRHNHKTMITLFIRADVWPIKKTLAAKLANPRFYLAIGIQSLNTKTLAGAKRMHNTDVLNKNIQLLMEQGANLIPQFIIGLPGDKYDDILSAIDWAFSVRPYDIMLQTLRINPGTVYEKDAKKFGITYKKNPPYTIFRTNTMSEGELKKSERTAQTFQFLYRRISYRKKMLAFCKKTNLPISVLLKKLCDLNPYSVIFLPKNKILKMIDYETNQIKNNYDRLHKKK
ncbi:B12-binding domain-containing radical SAM protein [Candidatus Roizmanbacteria bacterium]|nr:B12-binding domain-containing radical SAM protein [Candidatus Roizmanbacteria bacterium]